MEPKRLSGVVSLDSSDANMYGCLPCPKCKSEYRAPYSSGPDAGMICCDDCGFKEPIVGKVVRLMDIGKENDDGA